MFRVFEFHCVFDFDCVFDCLAVMVCGYEFEDALLSFKFCARELCLFIDYARYLSCTMCVIVPMWFQRGCAEFTASRDFVLGCLLFAV